MISTLIIAVGAGLATALLFGSHLTGTSIALALYVLTPVPVAIAGFGWGALAGALAAAVATVVVAVATTPLLAAELLISFAGPAAWLAYLAGLWRADPAQPDGRQWYPLGRILVHAVGIVAVSLIVVGYLAGYNPEELTARMIEGLGELLAEAYGSDAPQPAELELFVRLNVALIPYIVAALNLTMLVFGLWLAGRITRTSQRLARPWTPLWTVQLPAVLASIFAAALALTFFPGTLGLAAAPIAGATGFGLALLGLAVLHTITLGWSARPMLLGATYALSIFLVVPVLVLALIGLVEATTGIRNRFPGRPTV